MLGKHGLIVFSQVWVLDVVEEPLLEDLSLRFLEACARSLPLRSRLIVLSKSLILAFFIQIGVVRPAVIL